MTVYPAVDVMGGSVVRLVRGDPSGAVVYSTDPAGVAGSWMEQGAEWIHLVSLDAAIGGSPPPLDLIGRIARLGVRVQYGGGLRTARAAVAAVRAGASRVVLGTLAASSPWIAGELVRELGRDAVAAALDAKDGRIASSGWTQTAERTPLDLARELAGEGVMHAVCTVVERDGTMSGADRACAGEIAGETGMEVAVSGGIGSLGELRLLRGSTLIAGVVVGKALYENVFTLREAIDSACRERAGC